MLKLEVFTDEYFPEVVVDRDEEKLVIKDYLCGVFKWKEESPLHLWLMWNWKNNGG